MGYRAQRKNIIYKIRGYRITTENRFNDKEIEAKYENEKD